MKRALVLVVLLLMVIPATAKASGIDFLVAPEKINIDALYKGTTLQIDGRVPEGTQVVLRFMGASENLNMKQKGKAFGLLWMNMNSLHFGNVPSVCLIGSSTPLKELGLSGTKLGFEGVSEGITIDPPSANRQILLPDLLQLKEHEGLFRQSTGTVTLGEKHDGMQAFSAKMDIPSRLSPGGYTVEVIAVRDGTIQAQASKSVDASLTGIPSVMANLAFTHGAWYGVLASLIAILGGLAIGLVFQSKGAH
jgi:hypothetical protein